MILFNNESYDYGSLGIYLIGYSHCVGLAVCGIVWSADGCGGGPYIVYGIMGSVWLSLSIWRRALGDRVMYLFFFLMFVSIGVLPAWIRSYKAVVNSCDCFMDRVEFGVSSLTTMILFSYWLSHYLCLGTDPGGTSGSRTCHSVGLFILLFLLATFSMTAYFGGLEWKSPHTPEPTSGKEREWWVAWV